MSPIREVQSSNQQSTNSTGSTAIKYSGPVTADELSSLGSSRSSNRLVKCELYIDRVLAGNTISF